MCHKIFFTLSLTALLTVGYAQNKKKEFSNIPNDLKINEIQVLGTHNSYAQPVDPQVVKAAEPILDVLMAQFSKMMTPEMKAGFEENHPNGMKISEGLNYNHPPFPDQLNAGIRNLEIDVYYDPQGGKFTKPAAYEYLKSKGITNVAPFKTEGLDMPGFKVLHMSDYDFRSHYPTLKDALTALKKWSDENPDHVTIFIQLEAKDMGIPIFAGSEPILKFDSIAFEALDKEIVDILGTDKIIKPDDVRGNYKTLNEAVLSKNWPTVNESRGKFIFMLLSSTAGVETDASYSKNRPNLEGRVMFVNSEPGQSFGAFLLLDNAIKRQEDIKKYVNEGYLVRTRSDIETYEAKINDLTRAEAAFSSGAQVISTDFYKPGNVYNTSYVVKLPEGGVARCNPINAKDKCNQ